MSTGSQIASTILAILLGMVSIIIMEVLIDLLRGRK